MMPDIQQNSDTLDIQQHSYLNVRAVSCGVDYSKLDDIILNGEMFNPTMLGLFLAYQMNNVTSAVAVIPIDTILSKQTNLNSL